LGGLASLVSNVKPSFGKNCKVEKKKGGGRGFDLEGVCKDFTEWETEFEERTNMESKGGNWM
jgi:hypothetical protein